MGKFLFTRRIATATTAITLSNQVNTQTERHRYNKALYKNSIALLADSDIGGYGSAYDLISQRTLSPFASGLLQPFLDVLTAMYGFVENRDGFAELTFDSRLESDHNAGMIYANMWEDNPEWRARFASKIRPQMLS